ncbi:MAG: terminase large subunit, partial [Chloroflexi bacterium]|nr:terminase large subunit [Chloroflexota bacterium]
ATERAIDLERWDACAGELSPAELEEACAGRVCYGGLDLSSTTDLTAAAFVFPPERTGEPFDVVMRFYMPVDRAFDPEARRRDRVPYDAWVDEGLVIATPGNVVDYGFVRRDLLAADERFRLHQVGYDPYNAQQLVTELEEEDGLTMVPIRQGFLSLSDPTKQLLRLYLSGGLRHGGHAVLRWMADNLVTRQDPAGNLKPDKEKSRQRIDGIVALVMALDRAIRNEGTGPESVYKRRGLVTIGPAAEG